MSARLGNAAKHLEQRLLQGRVDALKDVALYTGIAQTGPKPVLQNHLREQLLRPRLHSEEKYRILSIDMGIRNLAYCLLQVSENELRHQTEPFPTPQTAEGLLLALAEAHGRSRTNVSVAEWRRLDVSALRLSSATPGPLDDPAKPKGEESEVNLKESFDPSSMSRMAYALVIQHLLPMRPTHILIERQRHRSGGSSAVLEWSFRVNMLEAILHAILETLRHSSTAKANGRPGFAPIVQSINPKRMHNYWTSPNFRHRSELSTEDWNTIQKLPKGRQDKAARILIARSMIFSGLHLEENAAATGRMLTEAHRRRKKTELPSKTPQDNHSKLDDLTDCLLQGLALIDWEVNRRSIIRCFGSVVEDGLLPCHQKQNLSIETPED